MARVWRLEKRAKAKGDYWLLAVGRGEDRKFVSLKYVTKAEAEITLARIQEAEDEGKANLVLEIAEESHDALMDHLLGMTRWSELLNAVDKLDYPRMTLAEYYDEVFKKKRYEEDSPIRVAAATAETETNYWRHEGKRKGREKAGILDGPLGQKRLRDITDQDWEIWQESQTQLSPRSKVLRRNAYAMLFAYARRMGHFDYTPEFFRIKNATKTTRAKEDPLSLDEVRALLDAALDGGIPIEKGWKLTEAEQKRIQRDCWTKRGMWALAIGAGLRPGELVRVEWQDIDWTDQVLLVRGTKTEESAGTIPLTPFAYREMQLLHERLGAPKAGPCFTFKGKPVKEYKNALTRDRIAAGIERHVTPYLLRHSFATLAWSLGVPQEVARRIMRHTDNKMLDRIYCRPRPQDLVARAAKFDLDPPEAPTPPTEPGGAAPIVWAAEVTSDGAAPKVRRRSKKEATVTRLGVHPEA